MKLLKHTLSTLLALFAAIFIIGCSKSSEKETAPDVEAKLSGTPDVAIKTIVDAFLDSKGIVMWQSMPASYQNDINAVFQTLGSKVDGEVYDRVFATLNRAAKISEKQQEFIFNSSLYQDQTEEEIAAAREAFPAVISLLNTLTSSSIASSQELIKFDGHKFFDTTVSSILADVKTIAKMSPELDDEDGTLSYDEIINNLKNLNVVVVDSTETEATLKFKLPNESSEEEETFVKVEKRWVPKEMADEWSAEIGKIKQQLNSISTEQMAQFTPQINNTLAMFDMVLNQIESAKTQEEFDAAAQSAMMPIMGMAMSFMMMNQEKGAE